MNPLLIAGGLLAVAYLLHARSVSTPTPGADNTQVFDPTGKVSTLTGSIPVSLNGLSNVVKLAGQGTSGGTIAGSPSAKASTAARVGGAAIAVTGAIEWLKAHSTAGRIVGGTQTGAGIGTTIAPGLGSAIGAGIGALVGWASGINANDTKQARWDLIAKLGYTRDGNGFDRAVRVDLATVIGQPIAEALWSEAVGRIGRKDTAWNNHWMERVIHAFQGERVHAYQNDPTKGGQPVI